MAFEAEVRRKDIGTQQHSNLWYICVVLHLKQQLKREHD